MQYADRDARPVSPGAICLFGDRMEIWFAWLKIDSTREISETSEAKRPRVKLIRILALNAH